MRVECASAGLDAGWVRVRVGTRVEPCRLLLAPHPVLVALAALRALPAVLALLAALCLYLPVQAQPMVVVLHPFLAAMPPKAMLAPYVSRVAPVLLVLVAR